ncbi:V-set and immunoglobulin domain-containing protein 2-like [Polymixia lowei]
MLNFSSFKNVASYYLTGHTDIAPAYEGRVALSVDIPKQESTLRLSKVTEEDTSRFQCSVMIPGDDEGTTAAITSLLVLVPPSKPICGVQGNAEYWNNINLTCISEHGSPKPTYSWLTYNVQNIPRDFPPRTTDKDGFISLFNISMETSGFFICSSTNRIGSASCNFTLSVMPPTMNLGATAGIIGGVLAGILVLGIVIYCCCRKKDKNDKYAQGSPEAAMFHDNPTPEVREQNLDNDSDNQTKLHIQQVNQFEEKDIHQPNNYNDNTVGTTRHDNMDRYGGSRDRLDDQRERESYTGSRDRLDDQRERDRYTGSRDRPDDQRDRYGGSRDRLDDQRDRSYGSRDRLDDQRDRTYGSRDRLDDQRDRTYGSRDRLDDQRDHYGGIRDRLDV